MHQWFLYKINKGHLESNSRHSVYEKSCQGRGGVPRNADNTPFAGPPASLSGWSIATVVAVVDCFKRVRKCDEVIENHWCHAAARLLRLPFGRRCWMTASPCCMTTTPALRCPSSADPSGKTTAPVDSSRLFVLIGSPSMHDASGSSSGPAILSRTIHVYHRQVMKIISEFYFKICWRHQ